MEYHILKIAKPEIAVIVPSLNWSKEKREWAGRCISTCRESAGIDARWICCADGGTDPPEADWDIVIRNKERLGFEQSTNAAAALAKSLYDPQIYLFLNDDVIGYDWWLARMARAMCDLPIPVAVPNYTQGVKLSRPPASDNTPYAIVPRSFAIAMRSWVWETCGPWFGDETMQYPCDLEFAIKMAYNSIQAYLIPDSHVHHFCEATEWHWTADEAAERKRVGNELYKQRCGRPEPLWTVMGGGAEVLPAPKHYIEAGSWPCGTRQAGSEMPSLDDYERLNRCLPDEAGCSL